MVEEKFLNYERIAHVVRTLDVKKLSSTRKY